MAQYGGYNPYGPPGGGQQPPYTGHGSPHGQPGAPGYGGGPGMPPPGQMQQDPNQQPYERRETPGGGHTPNQIGELTDQMGGMGMGDPAAQIATRGKKKNRHAYHNLDQPSAAGGQQPWQQQQQQQAVPPWEQHGQQAQQPQPGQPWGQQQPQQGQPAPGDQFPQQGGQFVQSTRSGPQSNEVQGTGVQTQGRVDPEQVPSVPRARDTAEKWYQEHTYLTMEQHLPPPAAIPYFAFDQGNSSPKYARLTLNDIPASSEALASTSLPLGIVLQPLAPLAVGEQPIPVLDFGDSGPPRCHRCRTYINPFMTFRSGGNKFVCNMCTFPNDVPPEYFAPTDPSGVRVDRDSRPELKLGTVEYMVPKEYWAKPPVPMRHLFVIDVSADAVNRGGLEVFCRGILSAIYGEDSDQEKGEGDGEDPQPEERALVAGSKVGFVTYDRAVHFYNCSAKLVQAQMLVMPDVEEPFLPLGTDGLFVDPYEAKTNIVNLLRGLPQLFQTVQNPEPALLPTLTACMEALAATGGKIVCSLTALPTFGPGKLFMRDDKNMHGIDTEKKLFQTEHPNWRKCASKMVEGGIGVDFFMLSPSGAYMDIATIGHVSALTGGEVYHYANFHAPRDAGRVAADIKHNVTRETGYQCLMKVRCSNGLQVSSYHGNFLQHNFGADLEFGSMDADKAIGVMFSYDGKLDPRLDAHFQCALLYTTQSGERRVRCTNTVASVSEGGANCMRHADQDAVVAMIAKEAASRMTERTLKDIRSAITEKTIDILSSYRKSYSSSHPPGQLVLPELLKEFGMYTLSLMKCRAFKGGIEPSDRRTTTMRFLKSAPPADLSLFLYPRIYSLHDLEPEAGFPDAETGHLVVPPAMRATFARVQEGGAYLVSDGQQVLLWLHAQVNPNLLEDLFGEGMTELGALDPTMSELPVLQTHLNAQVRNLLAYWGGARGPQSIQLARQGMDGAEYEFARLLLEDRNADAPSYVDWLVQVHRGVQQELAGQRQKKDTSQAESEGTMAALRAMGW